MIHEQLSSRKALSILVYPIAIFVQEQQKNLYQINPDAKKPKKIGSKLRDAMENKGTKERRPSETKRNERDGKEQ